MPTFERFAGGWVVRQKDEGGRQQMGLSAAGQADLQWRMEHLLAYFAGMPLDEITVSEVDDFRLSKVREGTLGATSLLDAAGELDQEGRAAVGLRRPLIATLAFAGLRLGELLALYWHDVDLNRGFLRRTFASLLFALGEPPTYVMSQMGHTTPGLTLALYAREMNRSDGERQRLRALVTDEPQKPAATAPSTATATGSVRIIPVHGTAITARTADGEPARRS